MAKKKYYISYQPMDNQFTNAKNRELLPTSLLKDIEFDEFDQELQSIKINQTDCPTLPER